MCIRDSSSARGKVEFGRRKASGAMPRGHCFEAGFSEQWPQLALQDGGLGRWCGCWGSAQRSPRWMLRRMASTVWQCPGRSSQTQPWKPALCSMIDCPILQFSEILTGTTAESKGQAVLRSGWDSVRSQASTSILEGSMMEVVRSELACDEPHPKPRIAKYQIVTGSP